jgi:hypothetical protein
VGDSFVVDISGIDCTTVKSTDVQGCGSSKNIVPRDSSITPLATGFGGRNCEKSSQARPMANVFSTDTVRSSGINSSNVLIIPMRDLDSGK